MRLRKQILTQNDCYKAGRKISVKGVMVHSTGANNPKVSRYVPGDSEIGKNSLGNHWNKAGIQKCVHAFIGKFADGKIGTVQTLPWDYRGWHCAKGPKGSGNSTHIGFEICEDALTDPVYFKAVYQEAVELTAMLCKVYNLNPRADGVVICHQEGYRRGIASNHGDVLHWFPKHGKSMDDFRSDVAKAMEPQQNTKPDIPKEEDDEMLTYEQWKDYMDRYRKEMAELGESDPSMATQEWEKSFQEWKACMEQYRKGLAELGIPDWAKTTKEWDKAFEAGIIVDKSRPQDLATRAEAAAMILRSKP